MLSTLLSAVLLCGSAWAYGSEEQGDDTAQLDNEPQTSEAAQEDSDAEPYGSAAEVLAAALGELDAAEAESGYTKYGERYGYPTGAWCDMFVSWCAEQAGLHADAFPADISCTSHIKTFTALDRYHRSAARGGSYVPRQGDLIFFYNYLRYPDGAVSGHVGLVLCVADGYVYTVEGNTLTNRLDYSLYEEVNPERKYSTERTDRVCVKCYRLDEPSIHGYAVPDYADRTELAHDGFVDLGVYADHRAAFDTLAALDIMPATSSYTCSPRYGMTCGDFLRSVVALFDLPAYDMPDAPYADVTPDSPYYAAVSAAFGAGLIGRTEDGFLHPELYISGSDAQTILSRARTYVGMADRSFSFSTGDLSYVLTPYTIRADIAQALYDTLCEIPLLSPPPLPEA